MEILILLLQHPNLFTRSIKSLTTEDSQLALKQMFHLDKLAPLKFPVIFKLNFKEQKWSIFCIYKPPLQSSVYFISNATNFIEKFFSDLHHHVYSVLKLHYTKLNPLKYVLPKSRKHFNIRTKSKCTFKTWFINSKPYCIKVPRQAIMKRSRLRNIANKTQNLIYIKNFNHIQDGKAKRPLLPVFPLQLLQMQELTQKLFDIQF